MRHALRATAFVAVFLGLVAVPRPVEPAGASRESVAAHAAGKRGEAPAFRTGARPERRLAQAPAHALPPAIGALEPPPACAAPRVHRRGRLVGRARVRVGGARAPPTAV